VGVIDERGNLLVEEDDVDGCGGRLGSGVGKLLCAAF